MRWLKYILSFVLFLYVCMCLLLYFNQERVLFNPEFLPESHTYGEGTEVEIPLSDGLSMNCLHLKQSNSKGVLLYMHSNRGSIRFAQYQTRDLKNAGYDIFIPEYRGYGKTGGKINSEKQLYDDVQKAYDYLKQSYREDQIIIMGYSLGTGFATYLAANNKPGHLALVAPFTSMTDVKNQFFPFIPGFLLKYKLNNLEKFSKVNCPIKLFHGTADDVINVEFSKTLSKVHPDRTDMYLAKGKNHRRIIFDDTMVREIRKLFK